MADRREVLAEAIAVAERRYNEASSELRNRLEEQEDLEEAIEKQHKEVDERRMVYRARTDGPNPEWWNVKAAKQGYEMARSILADFDLRNDALAEEIERLTVEVEPHRRDLYRLCGLAASMDKEVKA